MKSLYKNDFELNAEVKGKIIKSIASVVTESEEELLIEFKGGFTHGRFLILEYKNVDQKIIQFGRMIFELSSNAKQLKEGM